MVRTRGPRCLDFLQLLLHLLPLETYLCEGVISCEQALRLWHVGGIPSGEHTGVLGIEDASHLIAVGYQSILPGWLSECTLT